MLGKNLLLHASVDHPGASANRRDSVLPKAKKINFVDFSKIEKEIDFESRLEGQILNVIQNCDASSSGGAASGISVIDSKKMKNFNQCLSTVMAQGNVNKMGNHVSLKESSEPEYNRQGAPKPQA